MVIPGRRKSEQKSTQNADLKFENDRKGFASTMQTSLDNLLQFISNPHPVLLARPFPSYLRVHLRLLTEITAQHLDEIKIKMERK